MTVKKCGVCREAGHDRTSCRVLKDGLEAKERRESSYDSPTAQKRFIDELARARKLVAKRERERLPTA